MAKRATDDAAPAEDGRTGDLIAAVGARVRDLRTAKAVPRRILSQASRVSPRYLAQLEAGKGNISIALLARVADALGVRIEALLADPDEGARIADLFRAAPEPVQAGVRDLLSDGAAVRARAHRICLIGLRGAGKSTLGARAGAALGVPFVELNREIETEAGMPVTEILALYGPEGYRRLEAAAIDRVVARHGRLILAAAGGIVADADTYTTVLERFHTIWLRARPEEHMVRVLAQGDTRPMAGNPAAMAQLKSILNERAALYARAAVTLDTTGRALDDSLGDLLDLIRRQGFLVA